MAANSVLASFPGVCLATNSKCTLLVICSAVTLVAFTASCSNLDLAREKVVRPISFDDDVSELFDLPQDAVVERDVWININTSKPAHVERVHLSCSCVSLAEELEGKSLPPGRRPIKLKIDTSDKHAISLGLLLVIDGMEYTHRLGGVVNTDPAVNPGRIFVKRRFGSKLASGKLELRSVSAPANPKFRLDLTGIEADGLRLRLLSEHDEQSLNSYEQQVHTQRFEFEFHETHEHENGTEMIAKIPWIKRDRKGFAEIPFSFQVDPPIDGLSDYVFLGTFSSGDTFERRIKVSGTAETSLETGEFDGIQIETAADESGKINELVVRGVAPDAAGEFEYTAPLQFRSFDTPYRIKLIGTVKSR